MRICSRSHTFVLPSDPFGVYNIPTMNQQKFEFPPDDAEPKRKRYRKRKPLPPPKAPAPEPPALLDTPVVQKCGFCGSEQTLMGKTHVCTECHGILLRQDDEE